METRIENNILKINGREILAGISGVFTAYDAPHGGVFLSAKYDKARSLQRETLGKIAGMKRFAAVRMQHPFFPLMAFGKKLKELPRNIVFLMAELAGGEVLLALPILDDLFRGSLESKGDELCLVSETGDEVTFADASDNLLLITGKDPYAAMKAAALSISEKTGCGLLKNKRLPEILDYIGWCSWETFGFGLSHEKLVYAMTAFKEKGWTPSFVIVDDNWQQIDYRNWSHDKLVGFDANRDKFPQGIAGTAKQLKSDFDIKKVIVWHATMGYWGGASKEKLPKYKINYTKMKFAAGVMEGEPQYAKEQDFPFGLVEPESISDFYNDYHSYLRAQGVDGVKVDTQYVVGGSGNLRGGANKLAKTVYNALEASINVNFEGNGINCMCTDNYRVYNNKSVPLTRSSQDYNQHQWHGRHVQGNALASLWMREFVYPDWDMFMAGNYAGFYHAVSRVVGGSPVYLTDRADNIDVPLVKKLIDDNNKVLRPLDVGVPSRDSLFIDAEVEPKLFKIFNRNEYSYLVGAFNGIILDKEKAAQNIIKGEVSASDIEFLRDAKSGGYIVYSHSSGKTQRIKDKESVSVTLGQIGADLFTFIPIGGRKFIPLGIVEKLNVNGTVKNLNYLPNGGCSFNVTCGGGLGIWSESAVKVTVNGKAAKATLGKKSGLYKVNIPTGGAFVCAE